MDIIITKNFYFVSNISTGTVTVIDSLCNTILKEITVGKRPFKLALKDTNTIVVACDFENTISFVNCTSGQITEHRIPNDGNLQIDMINKKIYISNTSEVIIYDINAEKLLGSIKGFSAIIDFRLNKEGSKLYVLDTLLKELRIYATDGYELISVFDHLDINPTYILISNDDKTVYISMQKYILKIDIDSREITNISLPKGSFIAAMIINDNILYASNMGLNRIELINTDTDKVYNFILTSKPEPTRLFITDDYTKLLIANRSRDDYGGIDIIDIKTNSLISSILMKTINSQPYDVISLNVSYTYAPSIATNNLKPKNKQITILAKKIFASYNETLNFPFININLPNEINSSYVYKSIKFDNGIIVHNSESRDRISEESGYSSIKFIVRVNYTISYHKNNQNNIENGFFEKPIYVSFVFPIDRDLEDFQLNIKTITDLVKTPKILGNVIDFGTTTLMELKIIGEDEITLSNSQENYDNAYTNFEEFSVFNGSLFPIDTTNSF